MRRRDWSRDQRFRDLSHDRVSLDRATVPGRVSWRKTLILHRDTLCAAWCKAFPKHDFSSGRLARYSLDSFERACDRAEAEWATRLASPVVLRARRLLADDVWLDRLWRELNEGHPTPSATVEAIWLAVRERGLATLHEPDTKARLDSCDEAARVELVRRIEKLRGAK
jgi:hypothetical protein